MYICILYFNYLKTIYGLQKSVKKGIRPDLSLIECEALQVLLPNCWSPEPEKRPTFNKIIETLQRRSVMKVMEADKSKVESYLKKTDEQELNVEEIKEEVDNQNYYSIFKYALMLYNGEGIKVNKEEAAKYFSEATSEHKKAIEYFKYRAIFFLLKRAAFGNIKDCSIINYGNEQSLYYYGLM